MTGSGSIIGANSIPVSYFSDTNCHLRRPYHDISDPFFARHPKMDVRHRAKIFNPFNALKGYDEELSAKNIQYEPRRTGNEHHLDVMLTALAELTENSRVARANNTTVTVEHFVLCSDPHHDAFGVFGRYVSLTGKVWAVDMIDRFILVERTKISFDDLWSITWKEEQPHENN